MYENGQPSKTLVLFDFDGTLYPKDSFTQFIFYAIKPWQIISRGLPILPWILAYYLKVYPAHKMRGKLFHAMFHGQNYKVMKLCAERYAAKKVLQLSSELYLQLQRHQARGHQVVLVSASVDLYLLEIAKLLELELLSSQVEIQGDQLTGRYLTADCSYDQKKQRILERYDLRDYSTIYAYGNSMEDQEMLSLAQHAYMVGQSEHLPHLEN